MRIVLRRGGRIRPLKIKNRSGKLLKRQGGECVIEPTKQCCDYTQVKISAQTELAAAFKAKCSADGVSMASEISRFMRTQTDGIPVKKPAANPFATRQLRRKALKTIIAQLQQIMEAEQTYLDNMPHNLQNSRLSDAAQQTVSDLDEALVFLNEAYQ